tara:strand:- start:1269 stop:1865 length:597 start_codon:yes stop_codon:yes gene_type:complete
MKYDSLKGKNKVNLLQRLWSLERKFKIFTYFGLIFLTFKTWNINQDYNALNDNYIQLKVEFAKLETFNASLVSNMIIYNRNYEEFPLPVWQKVKRGDEFIIQYINPQYVSDFGHIFNDDQYALVGKNNFDMFPYKIAQQYYNVDLKVANTGIVVDTTEYSLDEKGLPIKLRVLKWRDIKEKKDTLIYGMVKEILKNKK